MGRYTVFGYLMQVKGKTKTTVGKLAGNRLWVLSGKKDRVAGKLQAKYSLSFDEAKTIKDWNLF
ncbi:CsbD-like protein [Methylophilaceae bacterium 11]|jgi:uncharacterized protein YjbJ (UPF0337 family)|uniref:CsbD family protein n=1 Tax=unclassified Methylotenera TaxID=2643294 RepID=UPI00037D7C7C|nr:MULTISPECIES: CsbD family protein [unclassified Methylotenera]EUJ10894.1 CsbD-like protein [Methylophilaceae bacterium 11]